MKRNVVLQSVSVDFGRRVWDVWENTPRVISSSAALILDPPTSQKKNEHSFKAFTKPCRAVSALMQTEYVAAQVPASPRSSVSDHGTFNTETRPERLQSPPPQKKRQTFRKRRHWVSFDV